MESRGSQSSKYGMHSVILSYEKLSDSTDLRAKGHEFDAPRYQPSNATYL